HDFNFIKSKEEKEFLLLLYWFDSCYHCMYKNQTTWIQQEIYQAEVSRLMDLIVNSLLYSNKEVFLRELISKDAGGDNNLIGQFGVGFYYAFLVSDKRQHSKGGYQKPPSVKSLICIYKRFHQPPPLCKINGGFASHSTAVPYFSSFRVYPPSFPTLAPKFFVGIIHPRRLIIC
ncbi:hypothetical protein PIB30_105473, partial [Stylosanthes scabra]|nr:hypothetical protein [Stylosanthes scabra]